MGSLGSLHSQRFTRKHERDEPDRGSDFLNCLESLARRTRPGVGFSGFSGATNLSGFSGLFVFSEFLDSLHSLDSLESLGFTRKHARDQLDWGERPTRTGVRGADQHGTFSKIYENNIPRAPKCHIRTRLVVSDHFGIGRSHFSDET